jgi:DNA invertase Pin-like site-specific DNA recombinase
MKDIPVAILVRVSTKRQETERQIQDLRAVAESKGWAVVEIIREQITGSTRLREALNQVIAMAESGHIKKVLVHEVSRVARRNSVAHDFLERLEDAKVSLYWHAQAIETLLPNGKRNPAAGVMFALLAEMARAEKETLVERIVSGLAEARRRGRTLGRPVGSCIDVADLLLKHSDIVRGVKAGKSMRDVAARTGKSLSTVKRVKAVMNH